MINWRYVGGATGLQLLRPEAIAPFGSYTRMLFVVMALLGGRCRCDRALHRSARGSAAACARCATTRRPPSACGVPTLKLKLFACTVTGALMGVAGAPMPMYLSVHRADVDLQPRTTRSRRSRMPMIGGTTHWVGPVIGALLLGTLQQIVTVTISGEVNVLVVGVLLVLFVVVAPEGILGLLQAMAEALPRR